MTYNNVVITSLLAVKLLHLVGVAFGQVDPVVDNRWRKTALDGYSFEGYKAEFQNTTTIGCAKLCSQDDPCKSFSVHSQTKRCLIYTLRVSFGVNMTREDGYKHYWRLLDNCPSALGYIYDSTAGVCYKPFIDTSERLPWIDAHYSCQDDGGHLYIPNTQAKMDVITQLVVDYSLQYKETKLGGNDLYEEGTFAWLDGTPVDPDLWQTNQPDNLDGDQDCIEPTRNKPTAISDGKCSSKERYVCEIPVQ